MNAIDLLLTGHTTPGLYRLLHRGNTAAIGAIVATHGWRFFHLDGRHARDKATFLAAAAAAMAFPAYFGHNWDAFEECVNDLSWAPASGYVLLYDHLWWLACDSAPAWQSACAILQEASRNWSKEGIPFYTLVRGTHGCGGITAVLGDQHL